MAETKGIYKKMLAIMADVGYVQKDAKVNIEGGRGYTYASAENILSKVRESLIKHGVCTNTAEEAIKISDDFRQAAVRLTVAFLDVEDGSFVTHIGHGQGKDAGDKALMKAQTAAIKYAMARAFNISWGDDPEADPKVDNIDNAPTEAPKKAPSARRAATKATTENTPELTAEALKSRIINCGIVNDLEKLRPLVMGFKGTEDYARLVSAFTARKNEISETSAGAN